MEMSALTGTALPMYKLKTQFPLNLLIRYLKRNTELAYTMKPASVAFCYCVLESK